jgi:hypothetical protein
MATATPGKQSSAKGGLRNSAGWRGHSLRSERSGLGTGKTVTVVQLAPARAAARSGKPAEFVRDAGPSRPYHAGLAAALSLRSQSLSGLFLFIQNRRVREVTPREQDVIARSGIGAFALSRILGVPEEAVKVFWASSAGPALPNEGVGSFEPSRKPGPVPRHKTATPFFRAKPLTGEAKLIDNASASFTLYCYAEPVSSRR